MTIESHVRTAGRPVVSDPTIQNPLRMLRLPEVVTLTGLPRSTIYERMEADTFPNAVRLGPRTIAWRAQDIYQFLDNLPPR